MKKILYLMLSLLLFTSCEEDVVTDPGKLQQGGFARFSGNVVQTADFQNGNGKVIFSVEDANENAVKYKIYKVGATIQGVDYPAVATNYEYALPSNVELTLGSLAQLFGLTSADLYFGDKFTFFAEVTTTDGRVFRGESPATNGSVPSSNVTTVDLLNTSFGYKQAMKFDVTVACASYDVNQMVGTYVVTADAFDEYFDRVPSEHTVQCVAGPTPNTLRFINFSNLQTDMIVTINPASQSATSARAKIYNNFYTFGDCFAEGVGGLVFSCIGELKLNMRYSVGAGTFGGTFNMTFTKQ
jgi:hypothetical protein